MKIIISGGWSYGNIGDEVILKSTDYLVKKYFPNDDVIYTSYCPTQFEKEYNQAVVKSIHRYWKDVEANEEIELYRDMTYYVKKLNLEAYEKMFDKDTLFIMSGGGYFMSIWPQQFISRILEIEIAKKMGAKIAVIGQSIGPIVDEKSQKLFSDIMIKCDYINVRDEMSKRLIECLCPGINVRLGSDIAIIIDEVFPQYRNISERENVNMTVMGLAKYGGIDTKKSSNSLVDKVRNLLSFKYMRYTNSFKQIVRNLANNNSKVHFVMSTNWDSYVKFSKKITSGVDESNYTINCNLDVEQMCKLIAKGGFIISTKLHPIIVASSYGIESVAVSYNYKVDEFMKAIGREKYCYKNIEIDENQIIEDYSNRIGKISNYQMERVNLMKKNVHEMFQDLCMYVK